MKKLNNKGITTIEVLVCFIIIVVITVSMYSTISYYNEKRIVEGYKQKIMGLKNELTRDIHTDLIGIGLVDAKIDKDIDVNTGVTTYVVDMHLRDSTERRLEVIQTLTRSSYHPQGKIGVDDHFSIRYGQPDNMLEYDIPNLGSYITGTSDSEIEVDNPGKVALDLSINNVSMEIQDDRILFIYIGFYHPEIGTRYGINIVAPIDFVFSNQ